MSRTATLTVTVKSSYRGFGRAEHCVDAQAAALRDLADRIAGPAPVRS